jgi:dipeptidyl aminopeptidase/acylaminoacyl peptidase
MVLHPFEPADLKLFGWAQDARLSPAGDRVAWTETELDYERDEPVSRIAVTSAEGGVRARRFSGGPHDSSPRWSPDGRWLAYLSAGDGPPRVMLAALDGGQPQPVETPGAVLAAEWSPQGDRLVLVVNMKNDRPKNAPLVMRGLYNRLDGRGWLDGRDHLFIYDLNGPTLRQLTAGDYDHASPSWSPDGSTIAFLSDRSPRRDDRVDYQDVWTIAARGGRPRRLTTNVMDAGFPIWSPDGLKIAFTGVIGPGPQAGRDIHLLWVPVNLSGSPAQVAPGLDRPTGFSLSGRCFAWVGPEELVFSVVERGTIAIHRAALDAETSTAMVCGEAQVLDLHVAGGRLAFTSAWLDRPAEVFCGKLGETHSQVSNAGDRIRQSVRLMGANRLATTAPDGLEIEYWVIPPAAPRGRARPPLYLEIHGGPQLHNPIPHLFPYYQALSAAGYLVVMPNPRGSIGFGELFTKQVRGDWGGADFDDLMACVDDVLERGLADPERQFVGGYSYGGFMSALTIGRTGRFRAACVGAPIVNMTSQFGTWDGGAYFADAMAQDPWSGEERYRALSPLTHAPKVSTPVLLYVNDGDLRCPPSQADEFFAALKWAGKEIEYVRYPGGSHLSFFPMVSPPSTSEDRIRRIIAFLGTHGGGSGNRGQHRNGTRTP